MFVTCGLLFIDLQYFMSVICCGFYSPTPGFKQITPGCIVFSSSLDTFVALKLDNTQLDLGLCDLLSLNLLLRKFSVVFPWQHLVPDCEV